MELPIWAFFGFGAAVTGATMMVLQERFKANGFSMAVWNKIMCVSVMIPFVSVVGLPDSPKFYLIVCAQSVLWAVTDVILFNIIPKYGAGVVSRVLPVSVLAPFFIWLPFDPDLVSKYLGQPWMTLGIFALLCGTVFFATRLRKCAVSWPALRAALPIIVASMIGPIFAKLAMQEAGPEQGAYGWVFIEAATMLVMWGIYARLRKPVSRKEFLARPMVRAGAIIGTISSAMVVCSLLALHYAVNPAYAQAIKLMSAAFVVVLYKIFGQEDRGDVIAGFGIVGCAIALVLLDGMQH